MADASLHLDTQEYTKFLKDHPKDLLVVDFYADWCPHCRSVGPVLEGIARSYKSKNVYVIKIDTEKEDRLARENKVEYLPTIIWWRDGKELERVTGSRPASFFEETIKKYLE